MPGREGIGFLPAAKKILEQNDQPMTCKAIVLEAIEKGLLATKGKTPERTLYTLFMREIKSKAEVSEFLSVEPGKFSVRK